MRLSVRIPFPVLLALAALLTVVSIGLVAASRSDANTSGGCSDGDVCVWNQNNYASCSKDMSNDRDFYTQIAYSNCPSLLLNDTVNSVKNRGNCNVRMYGGTNRTGQQITFAARNSGGTINDPMLANGGGASGAINEDWADRIGSHNFCV